MQLKNQKKVLKGGIAAGTIFILIFSLLVLLLGNSPVSGAETEVNSVIAVSSGVYFYVQIEGANQGMIDGSVQTQGYQNWIEGYQYSHSLYIPTDPHTGQATGRKVHTPIVILKEVDKSTPKLLQAFSYGETLVKVLIRFFRTGPTGSLVNYFTVSVDDAIINSIREFMPNNLNPGTYQPLMEEISLVYRRITWTWEADGIEFTDDWDIEHV